MNCPVLLLAPLDPDAAHVLSCQLKASGLSFQTLGPVLALDLGITREVDFLQKLQDCVSSPLQRRVKGVVTDSLHDSEDLMHRLMRAELLTELFEQTDVEWLRGALAQDRIFSVFHPIVRACDGSVFAHEALVRAQTAHTDEAIGAGQLVYAARKLDIQHEFDQAARLAAIRGAAEQGLHGTSLFVNFLPNTIYDPEVCLKSTVEAAEQCGIGMERIVFEVVETEQIHSLDRLRHIVSFLRRQGAGIALDDLSSGYASLQFLADLLPDYVKIDRDLVTMAAASSSARHTLESIVTLARKLNVKVIAEGVETEGQLKICVDAGVELLQGYLFAMPGCPPNKVKLPAGMRIAA